ncbi:E3 UFM1-protein ligase 1 [Macrobrachium rosenbergii]|uniref:E3 UFM1-protein ligase 1 n=1 Tax=Macrobrachium rosenbergii TaxID=79674 RepID=UPI0034D508F5
MSSSDWEEIKRLAADFQRAQLASTLQKLSERNCIEIISKLVELNLISIYYTTDGKEYVTPEQLTKEIQDELYVQGGRVDIADLVDILSVDYNVITKQATGLASSDPNIRFVMGQLISKHYMDSIAEEINEKLQQEGTASITHLVKHYDLPEEFLSEVTITSCFMSYMLCFILFLQYFRIFSKGWCIQYFQLFSFFSVAEKLIEMGRIPGILTGNQQVHRSVYIPNIYSQTQNDWVDNFWKQNGYLEFEALRRLDISDPEGYIRRRLIGEDITYIGEMCIGSGFIDQIDASLDDALVSGGWVDIYPLLPTSFSSKDGSQLLEIALRNRQDKKSTANARVFCDTIVVSNQIISMVTNDLRQLMPARAKEAIEQGSFKQQLYSSKSKQNDDSNSKNKKEERRKKAVGGKFGGGTQGRETKTKSVKNKNKGRRGAAQDSDSEDDVQTRQASGDGPGKFPKIEFLSLEKLQEEIADKKELTDSPEELIEEIAKDLQESLTKEFQEVVQAAFLATVAVGGDARKKTHQQLQEKVSALITAIRLSEKGIKAFDGEIQLQLKKHLLRTQCSELVSELVLYLADDSLLEVNHDKEMTPEVRLKIIKNLSEDMMEPLLAIHKSLTTSDMEEFLTLIDDAVSATGIMLKKKDNKKDRQVLSNHRCQLLEQLESLMDPPLILHLACLILFQSVSGCMLHASGKFVPHILAYIKNQIPADKFSLLQDYQDLVIKSLTNKDECILSGVKTQLEALAPSVKEIAVTFKKSTSLSHSEE